MYGHQVGTGLACPEHCSQRLPCAGVDCNARVSECQTWDFLSGPWGSKQGIRTSVDGAL
jgi:hypothetical protein